MSNSRRSNFQTMWYTISDFPFEIISEIAERESWRKEINRPPYHIHKWWARRLGTVFRAITLGALTPAGTDILAAFYRPTRLAGATVFDPFMGSGTEIGEAAKLGIRAIGRDINPVAYFSVRNALRSHDLDEIGKEFDRIERDVGDRIRSYYQTTLVDGRKVDVLYYFWVKTIPCPSCHYQAELFSSRIFARHANARKHPMAHALCPKCRAINNVRYDATAVSCNQCGTDYNPQGGTVVGATARCPSCEHQFPVAKTIRQNHMSPEHRLYAKLVLMPDGSKDYLGITDGDQQTYDRAVTELQTRSNAYPIVAIEPGYNTNQAIGYNYRHWHDMFNARQLLCLSILADRIRSINDHNVRELFTCLFSGTLEFNNMFASYKGEGTGAVRPMFANHILKPERMPLEANLWGTEKSSGSFQTLFAGRIRRAIEYAQNPFELTTKTAESKNGGGSKVFGLSSPIGGVQATTYDEFQRNECIYISCGDSSTTDIPNGSVDAVITDPPFFDNVHYSQLADFFHVWQRHILGETGSRQSPTTRSDSEVQNGDLAAFTTRLGRVWTEVYRVLRDDGILAFTYHHSRAEGWQAVLESLMDSGFEITAVHPVKAEMSVAIPKFAAKEPIDLDVIIACRKHGGELWHEREVNLWEAVQSDTLWQVERFRCHGRNLNRGDVRVVMMAQIIKRLSMLGDKHRAIAKLERSAREVDAILLTIPTDSRMGATT